MAYTPTLNDIPQEYKPKGFTPSLADIPQGYNPEQKSFKEAHPILSTLANIASGLQTGPSQGIVDILDIPHAIYGKIPALPNAEPSPMWQGVVDKSTPSYSVPESLSEMIPALIGGEGAAAKLIPQAKNALSAIGKTALTGGITGFGMDNSNLSDRAEEGVIGAALGGGLAGAGRTANALKRLYTLGPTETKGALSTLAQIANPKLGNKVSNEYLENISKGKDERELNSVNNAQIVGNYNAQKKTGTELYDKFLGEGKNAGYSDNVRASKSGLGYLGTPKEIVTGGKHIELSKESQNIFNSLKNADSNNELQKTSQNLKNAVNNFNYSPSLNNAHRLQSELGKEASYMDSKDTLQRNTKNLYSSFRNKLINDMNNTFIKNGDTHLNDLFDEAKTHWRENVTPYENAPQIKELVRTGDDRPNIINTLTKEDNKGRMDTIRSHLETNPEQQRNLLAQALKQGFKKKDVTTSFLEKQYNELPNVLKSATEGPISNDLMKMLDKQKTYKRIRRGAVTTGAVVGGNKLLKMIGINPMEVL
jgi:hypothetical protein